MMMMILVLCAVYERDMQQMIEREREGVAEKLIMCI
jgi:hypothetical protein